MRFQRNCIYYGRLVSEVLIGQAHHDPGPDTLFAAALEPVTQRRSPPVLPVGMKGLRRAMMLGRVAPPQAIAVDENKAAQDAALIDERVDAALGKERLQAIPLRLGQPVKPVR